VLRRVFASLIAVAALLALASGCGGGSDDDSLTKAEFSKQGNAICTRANADQQKALTAAYAKLNKEGAKGKKVEEDLISNTALPPIAKMTEELADLGTPEGEEEKAEQMVEAFEEEVQKIEDDPAGALSGTVGSFDEANKLAGEFGMNSCASV
jgi:hypothetical protein